MRAFRWRSINVLVVVGFAVVGLPLAGAILLSTVYLERLTALGRETVAVGVEGTRQGRILGEQLVAMERHARQYAVLREPALLDLLERRRLRFEAAARELQGLFDDPVLDRELNALRELSGRIRVPSDTTTVPEQAFAALLERSAAVNERIRALTEARMQAMAAQSNRTQERLLQQAGIVIAIAVLLGAVFALLISRAVRQLARAILRLGEGRFDRTIEVRGPADFEQLGAQLDWLRQRLQSVEEDKSAFLRNISHELKSPLANIREGSELLADGSAGELSPAQREVAAILRENSLRLQSQIENLLNFNAWQNVRTPLVREPVRLAELVERVLSRERLAIRARSLRVLTEMDDAVVSGDPQKLEVMIENLVSNAIKYSPPGGRLQLRVVRRGRRVELTIGDDGPGIPPAERKRVFRAFYQGRHAPQSHVHGTGIGLSVVRECVRAHAGKVSIIDGETNGATFRVELPAR